MPYTTQMMPSAKEPFTFKLNTESPRGLSLLFFPRTQDISTNTTIYCVIQQQLSNRKFIHESMTTIYRVSCEQSIHSTVNKRSSMKTIVIVLKDCMFTVK